MSRNQNTHCIMESTVNSMCQGTCHERAIHFRRRTGHFRPAERAACLDKACVQQPELRQQLDELLAAQRNRTVLTATLIVAASLVLGAVLATWQAVRELAAEGQATTAQVQAESERDRALSAQRRASESLQYSLEEKKRTGTATAEVGAERGKKEDFLKRTIVLDRLLSAMHAEHQGSVEAAERLYRNASNTPKRSLDWKVLKPAMPR